MSPAVSVIIPVYNMEEHIPECLDSILRQSLQDIEVLCIDDGSTDGSLSTLAEYTERDPRVKVLAQPNGGVSSARNRGIRECAGEYLIFCDPDDLYPDERSLEKLYTAAISSHSLIAAGSFSDMDEDVDKLTEAYTGKNSGYTFTESGVIQYSDYQFDYGFHRFLFNTRFLIEHGIEFPPYRRYQDPPFLMKALYAANSFYAIPDIVYQYRWGHKEVNWDLERKEHLLAALTEMLTFSSEHGLDRLHALTIDRVVRDWSWLFMDDLDLRLLPSLYHLNDAVQWDTATSEDAEFCLTDEGTHLIPPLKHHNECYRRALRENEELRQGFENIEGSLSFKIGRAATALPRSLRDALKH